MATRRVLMGPPLIERTSFKVDPLVMPQSKRLKSSCSSTPEKNLTLFSHSSHFYEHINYTFSRWTNLLDLRFVY